MRLLLVGLLATSLWAQAPAVEPGTVKEAKQLGKQGSTAIPRLAQLVNDPDNGVRQEAVKSLCDVGTQYSLDPLIAAAALADADIQVRAADCLVTFYYPGYYKSGISGLFKKVGSSVKDRFIAGEDPIIGPLVEVRPEVVRALIKLLQSGIDMTVRANAARGLGVLRAHDALDELHEALKSKNTDLIYESLVALRKIGDRSSGERVWFLLRDLDDKVKLEAIEISGLTRNKEAIPRLKDLLQNKNKDVRRAALQAIARMPDASTKPLFDQYLGDPDTTQRAVAAEGIGRIGDIQDLPRITKLFDGEKRMEPRLAAGFSTVMLGDVNATQTGALRYLVNTLNSAAYHGIAEPYLIELARKQAVRTILLQWLPAGTSPEKLGLLHVMAASGGPEALPVLEQLRKDADLEVSKEAIRAAQLVRARMQ